MSNDRAAPLLRQTFQDWIRHRCISKGAALAFYALLSFAPLLVLVIALAGAVFGPEAAAGEIVRQLDGLIGREGAKAVQAMIKGAHNEDTGAFASGASRSLRSRRCKGPPRAPRGPAAATTAAATRCP